MQLFGLERLLFVCLLMVTFAGAFWNHNYAAATVRLSCLSPPMQSESQILFALSIYYTLNWLTSTRKRCVMRLGEPE